MFNFMDSSDNLTVKTLVTLDWAQRYYRSQYFFNVDDDMLVKLKIILIILKKCVQHDKVIIGDCNMKAPPDRKRPANIMLLTRCTHLSISQLSVMELVTLYLSQQYRVYCHTVVQLQLQD